MAFVCARCLDGSCNRCIDIMRVIVDLEPICRCKVPGHGGEPVDQQILDPETGTVYGPNVVVSAEGDVTFPASITCLKCGMTSHNPNDIKNMYCGNCHKFHSETEF